MVLVLRLATPLVQVNSVAKRQVTPFYLSNRFVQESVERGHVGVV